MPLNSKDFIVFDFETTGLRPGYHEVCSLAAKAYKARTLEPYPVEEGGEFKETLMKPLHFDRIDMNSLRVNGITVEQLKAAPDQGVVWNSFVEWVNGFNPKKTKLSAPIACGKNIRRFDLKFIPYLNELHCKKKDKTILFNEHIVIDLEDIFFLWFEGEAEPKDQKMDTLREFFGLSSDKAHTAEVDVKQEGALIMHFLKLHRTLQRRMDKNGEKFIKFKDSMRGLKL